MTDKHDLRNLRKNGASGQTEDPRLIAGLQFALEGMTVDRDNYQKLAFDRGRAIENWRKHFYEVKDDRDELRDQLQQAEAYLREACERLADIIEGDDGEAYFEGEKFLKRHAPDIYNVIGASLDPVPDFPEPTMFDKVTGFIVGMMQRKPKP